MLYMLFICLHVIPSYCDWFRNVWFSWMCPWKTFMQKKQKTHNNKKSNDADYNRFPGAVQSTPGYMCIWKIQARGYDVYGYIYTHALVVIHTSHSIHRPSKVGTLLYLSSSQISEFSIEILLILVIYNFSFISTCLFLVWLQVIFWNLRFKSWGIWAVSFGDMCTCISSKTLITSFQIHLNSFVSNSKTSRQNKTKNGNKQTGKPSTTKDNNR